MEVEYSPKAIADIIFWKQSGQKLIQKKIQNLIEDIKEHPYTGIGKPEPLKHELTGVWSRRISNEHRLVYEITNSTIQIHSLRGHY